MDDWCEYEEHLLTERSSGGVVRCPRCRKRLILRTLDAEPHGNNFTPVYVIPPHKLPYKKRPSVKAAKAARARTH